MSQENVEIIKRVQPSGFDMAELIRTPTAPDLPIDLTVFERDFETEFIASRAGASIRPNLGGLQGFVEAWRDWLEPWVRYYIEVEEFIDAGDVVVALVRIQAKGHQEVSFEHAAAALWSVRAGKIVQVRFYHDRAESLEAAGLRE